MKRQILHSVLLAIVAMMMFALPQYAQAQTKEAYVVKNDDGKTLTFYYDTQKATRPGDKWGINETQTDYGITLSAWSGTFSNPNTTTTQAVIDPSFKDFRPKTTAKWFFYFNTLEQITGIEHLNTEEVTDMSNMFFGCFSLTQLDVSKFDTKNVTDMCSMFYECRALTQLNVSKFDTKNVTDMSYMFYECQALKQLDVSNFDTKNVTTMYCMFNGCQALTQLNVSKFDTKNVTDMDRMFDGCKALTQIDVSNFNTQNVTYMRSMFKGCAALTTIYCNDAWTCLNSAEMFSGSVKLKGAVSYDPDKTDATMANPDTGYFTKKGSTGIAQTGHAATVKAIYSVDGCLLKEPQPGVNIMKMSDGTTRKVVKK